MGNIFFQNCLTFFKNCVAQIRITSRSTVISDSSVDSTKRRKQVMSEMLSIHVALETLISPSPAMYCRLFLTYIDLGFWKDTPRSFKS